MGGIGRAFGRLLGVKEPKVPKVTAPPTLAEQQLAGTTDGTEAIDQESLTALAAQEQRRNITATAGRSLLGAGLSEDTQQSLLQNVESSAVGLEQRDDRVNTRLEQVESSRVAAAAKAKRDKTEADRLTAGRSAVRRRKGSR